MLSIYTMSYRLARQSSRAPLPGLVRQKSTAPLVTAPLVTGHESRLARLRELETRKKELLERMGRSDPSMDGSIGKPVRGDLGVPKPKIIPKIIYNPTTP